MIDIVRRHIKARATGDDGIALVVAIALIAVVGMLIAAMVAVAMFESRSTGRDRQRSQAVAAAEQSVDALMAQIQGIALAGVPCGPGTANVTAGSDRLQVASSVRFFDQGGLEISCSAVRAGSTRAFTAAIEATATSEALMDQRAAQRQIEVLIQLEPEYGNDLDKAIFGDQGVTLANHADIYGENGQSNADLYSNKDVICNNNEHFYGSLYAQGQVRLDGPCTVEVDVHAKGTVYAQNSAAVNGRVLSVNGPVQISGNNIGQQIISGGAINAPSVCSTPNKCFPNTAVPPVPTQTFPILNWDGTVQSEWAAQGYTNVVEYSGAVCSQNPPNPWNGKGDWVAYDIMRHTDGVSNGSNPADWTGDTIIVSRCPQKVQFQGIDLRLPFNMAIFSFAGIMFSNNTDVTSSDGVTDRNLYFIHPYNAVSTHPCTTMEGITLDNSLNLAPQVHTLMYTPCNARKANNTNEYGQIYAGGKVTIDNRLTMSYVPLPVWGVIASTTIESYTIEIQYKREDA